MHTVGWRGGRDEIGDRYAEIRIDQLVLSAIIGRRDTRWSGNEDGLLIFQIGGSITTDAISAAYTILFNPKKKLSQNCIISQHEAPEIKKNVVSYHDIERISDHLIDWATNIDIDAGLKELRELPTDSLGDMPARLLAALAEAGEVETLERYQRSFAYRDCLGFVPYITDKFIDRALEFARQRREDPKWLPAKPRLRV